MLYTQLNSITYYVLGISPCDKSAILTAVAKQTEVVNQNAGKCSTGSHSSHDALVLTHCQVPSSVSLWQQGTNVCIVFFYNLLHLVTFYTTPLKHYFTVGYKIRI